MAELFNKNYYQNVFFTSGIDELSFFNHYAVTILSLHFPSKIFTIEVLKWLMRVQHENSVRTKKKEAKDVLMKSHFTDLKTQLN